MAHTPSIQTWLMLLGLLAVQRPTTLFADEVTVRPAAAPGPLDNPLKGWCPYTEAGKIYQPYSMVFMYVPWKDLEPNQGQYEFETWEKAAWTVPAAKGKHILFRVYVDYPSHPSGLPEWLKEEGVKLTPYSDHGGGVSPDYDDPKLIAALEDFIAALGSRYNSHPRVAFVQLGLLGFWGEWHTWPRQEMYASAETERRIIDAYHRAFPDKSLMVRYARDYAGQQPWIGFHDDLIPEDTDNGREWSFLAGLRRSGRMENWRRAVIGGEMVPNQAARWLGSGYGQTLAMLQRAHFTWMGPYCPALHRPRSGSFQQRCHELVRRMGYQFQLTEIRHPGSIPQGAPLTVSFKGRNDGVAPFYYPWPVELALLDGKNRVFFFSKTDCDVREWLPGDFHEITSITLDVPPGNYQLAIGIRDPWSNKPAIGFANQLPRHDGWTVLSNLSVTGSKK